MPIYLSLLVLILWTYCNLSTSYSNQVAKSKICQVWPDLWRLWEEITAPKVEIRSLSRYLYRRFLLSLWPTKTPTLFSHELLFNIEDLTLIEWLALKNLEADFTFISMTLNHQFMIAVCPCFLGNLIQLSGILAIPHLLWMIHDFDKLLIQMLNEIRLVPDTCHLARVSLLFLKLRITSYIHEKICKYTRTYVYSYIHNIQQGTRNNTITLLASTQHRKYHV